MCMIFRLMLGLALLWSTSAFADQFIVPTADGPRVIMVSELEGLSSVTGLLDLEPNHLLALGAGVLLGAAVIGPVMGISELFGVVMGVIGADVFYRSDLWPLPKSRWWFQKGASLSVPKDRILSLG